MWSRPAGGGIDGAVNWGVIARQDPEKASFLTSHTRGRWNSGKIRGVNSVLHLSQDEAFEGVDDEVVIRMLQQGHMRILQPG